MQVRVRVRVCVCVRERERERERGNTRDERKGDESGAVFQKNLVTNVRGGRKGAVFAVCSPSCMHSACSVSFYLAAQRHVCLSLPDRSPLRYTRMHSSWEERQAACLLSPHLPVHLIPRAAMYHSIVVHVKGKGELYSYCTCTLQYCTRAKCRGFEPGAGCQHLFFFFNGYNPYSSKCSVLRESHQILISFITVFFTR